MSNEVYRRCCGMDVHKDTIEFASCRRMGKPASRHEDVSHFP